MTAPSEIRLLLVDDSQLVRHGIRAVLERAADARHTIKVVGEADSMKTALDAVDRLHPHIVLLDLRLPDGFGFTVCREILARHPATRILVLTSYMDDKYIYESIVAGAHGYLMKEIEPALLVDAVIRVAGGESIISPDLTARVLRLVRHTSKTETETLFTTLSPQEKRVLELVSEGRTNKEIGDLLKLSDNTVKNYLGNVFEKLKVKRRSQAAALFTQVKQGELGPNRPSQ